MTLHSALLIGINKYPNSPLRGCVNDMKNMAALLRENYGANIDNTLTCLDHRATTQGMLDRIEEFVIDAAPGQWSLYDQSGHGSTYSKPIEPDGNGECICPVDYDGSPAHMITDATLCDILRLKHDDAKILIVLDTCFSYGMGRVAGPVIEHGFSQTVESSRITYRYLPPTAPMVGKVTSSMVSNLPPNVVILAGAGEDQTGADAVINGVPQGAAHYFLIHALRTRPSIPMPRLIDAVNDGLEEAGYSQRAGLLGDSALFTERFLG